MMATVALERKLAALDLHEATQAEVTAWGNTSTELAREHGRQAGVSYAEGLEVVRMGLW